MKQKKITVGIILTGYAVPWAFLALYGDWKWGAAWLYAGAAAFMLALGWLCGKIGPIRLGVAGNLLSAVISCLCAWGLWQNRMGYFKPFSAAGWAAVLSLVLLMMQYLLWYPKTRKEPWQSLLAAVCAAVLVGGGGILLLLLWNAWEIGAI